MEQNEVKKQQIVRINNLMRDFRTIDLDPLMYYNRCAGRLGLICYPVNSTFNRRWTVIHEDGTYGIYHHTEMTLVADSLPITTSTQSAPVNNYFDDYDTF